MSEPRVIRKYVNRRLYDTVESRYVNLDDLRRVINAGGEIRVVDQASGRDITTTVLLQIIGEAERSGAPLLTRRFSVGPDPPLGTGTGSGAGRAAAYGAAGCSG